MRSEPGSKTRREETKKEESRKHRLGVGRIGSPPRLNFDPQKRKDFFNKLLEKYSEKTTKIETSTSNYTPQNDRFPLLPQAKISTKLKEKTLKKKKNNSDRPLVKTATPDSDSEESWKESVKCHVINDMSCYKNHYRIKSKYPCPMKTILEKDEACSSSEEFYDIVSSEESRSLKMCPELLPSGDQINGRKSVKVRYEKTAGVERLPEEIQTRHITKTPSGTLVWVGNNSLNKAIKLKNSHKSPAEKEVKVKVEQTLEGSTTKKSIKVKRNKPRKTLLPQEQVVIQEKKKGSKRDTEDSSNIKQCSSLATLPNGELKPNKKGNEKVKKPKKLIKKPSVTLVTSTASTFS